MKTTPLLSLFLLPLLAFGSGGSITSNRYNLSLVAGTGQSINPSYGQLNFSPSHSLNFETSLTWIAIPCTTFSPSSDMESSLTYPPYITIQQAGVYQVNINLYLTLEPSIEGGFVQTNYTIGISTNGGSIVACASLYAADAGDLSLSYSTLKEFSENDTVKFYIQTSDTGGGGPFENVVTLISGNASLIQVGQ